MKHNPRPTTTTASGTGPPGPRSRDGGIDGSQARVLATALESAVRAPSGHNTQPWRFRLAGDRVELYADRSRALPVVDPTDRALTISCGATVAFLAVALRHAGFAADAVLLPDPTDRDLLATISPGRQHTPTDRDHQLFAAIEHRHTHRAPFQARAVPEDVLAAMTDDAERFGAALHVVIDDQVKQHVAELVAEGDRQQMANPRFRKELAAWMRSSYTRRDDGIPGYALGIPGLPSLIGPLLMRTIDMGAGQATKDRQLAATAPALLLLTTPGDTVTDWLAAGQALGTLLLTATAAGLAASFLNQPVETDALRTPLGDLLDPTGGRPQLVLRLGYPHTAAGATPRRPVAEVVDPTNTPSPPRSPT